jgi:UDPglucose--hexose-1-phosphate uridylyltransferase
MTTTSPTDDTRPEAAPTGTSPTGTAPTGTSPTGASFDRRVDRLTGAEVVVVAERQDRPNAPAGCPFCVGGTEAPEPYSVRAFPNRWPPLPDGRAEVVLYTSDHDATFASLGVDGATRVVELWATRSRVLGARPDVGYVLVFENRGPAVGATISHPHGQIYAFDRVPPSPAAELAVDPCPLCTERASDRLVSTAGEWEAAVPHAAGWPYELRISPRAHRGDFDEAAGTWRDLAAVLVDVSARLDQLFTPAMPAMLWWHQRPCDGGEWPSAHLHAHLVPIWREAAVPRFVAAGELGSGVLFNPVRPEAAAARLRALPGAGAERR